MNRKAGNGKIRNARRMQMEQAIYKSPPTLISTDRLVMYDVVNPSGEDMGQTQVFLIDLCSGKVAFAVVSFEGTLGISDKWFALPAELLAWSVPQGKFVLDLPRTVLERAPGIDKNKWPKEIDLDWLARACTHYGCTPYWAM
jgi:Rieske Fe-S protein